MTPSELKYHVEQTSGGAHFFTRKTMQFFGDTMRNYGVRSVNLPDHDGKMIPLWELFRRRPVKGGLHTSAYFHRETFRRMFPAKEADHA